MVARSGQSMAVGRCHDDGHGLHYRLFPGSRCRAKGILGTAVAKVVISDRLKSYIWIRSRQFCWAHLRRDFQAMIDRRGEAAEMGRGLLAHSDRLFDWWHRVRHGTMTQSTFRSYVAIIRFAVRDDLQQGAECPCSKTAATCRELQAGETHLWTFVRVEGIEPTNNEAGQSLRHAVLYRKTSGGNDSKLGSRFAEQILTVVATCRQQKLNVLENLTRCYQAHLDGQPAPPLLPASSIADHAAGSGFKLIPSYESRLRAVRPVVDDK